MLQKITPLLLALLPFFAPTAWAQDEYNEDPEGEDPKTEIADFQFGKLFYVINEDGKTVHVSPQYEEEGENTPGYAEENIPKGTITIPQTVTDKGKTYTVVGIDDNTFEYCTELTSIILPPTITTLGTSSLSHTGISKIELPAGLTEIQSIAFFACKSLTSISLPQNITSIAIETFKDCSALTSIELPGQLENIYNGAFRNCVSLKSITLPATLKQIDRYVFQDCNALRDVYCDFSNPAQVKYIGGYGGMFDGTTPNSMTLHVPMNTKEAFSQLYPWNNKFIEIKERAFTQVSTVDTSSPSSIQPVAGALNVTLSQTQKIMIHDLKGSFRLDRSLSAGHHSFSLQPGIYLVSIGTQTSKVAIQ